MKLKSYAEGKWHSGSSNHKELYSAVSGEKIAEISSDGLDFKAMLNYARAKGGPSLRKMTFHERGKMLKDLALYLSKRKENYYQTSYYTGATKNDSWIDIEGGFGTLFTYSGKARRDLPAEPFYLEGKAENISKSGTFIGHHIAVPLEGAAVHINAFNFPVWGMLEKLAPTWLGGMPAIIKPASITAYLTEQVVRDIIDSGIVPEGALQLICGNTGDLLDHLDYQDVVTFTGSASTGKKIKSHTNVMDKNVRLNLETDSLNFSMLGPDAAPGTEEFDLYIKEVAREMTIKAGQRCTAIRRMIVPDKYSQEVIDALNTRMAKIKLGDPQIEDVRMGPLAGLEQVKEVESRVKELQATAELVSPSNIEIFGDKAKGSYFPYTLLYCSEPFKNTQVHDIEAFGPVSSVMSYSSSDEAVKLAKLGRGSLVGSLFTADDEFAAEIFHNTAAHHGRIMIVNKESAKESTGHGSPMPHLVHGGPGRAGGGEELGGIRAVLHYMQRTAIQGSPTTISRVSKVWQKGAEVQEEEKHPFKKYFEELQIGDSLLTHKRTITETDIVNFTNVSWDNFYAHTDVTSLEGSLFERRVAHGYFVLAAAAGLFVHPAKGPVLANYGIDELRFTKPVYAGDTVYVRLTVREKLDKDSKEGEIPSGIVKWDVEVFNQENETAAQATILTLVAKKQV